MTRTQYQDPVTNFMQIQKIICNITHTSFKFHKLQTSQNTKSCPAERGIW